MPPAGNVTPLPLNVLPPNVGTGHVTPAEGVALTTAGETKFEGTASLYVTLLAVGLPAALAITNWY
ncbi:hypothetical protein H7F36_18990 [Variovorax sp. PAMC28562]|nr:hypothetical protein [Variovorax sp. PAMC28562]QNK73190.1 hypothetical protein H7F36_18990 [Variovorax sp. PAMC28562]